MHILVSYVLDYTDGILLNTNNRFHVILLSLLSNHCVAFHCPVLLLSLHFPVANWIIRINNLGKLVLGYIILSYCELWNIQSTKYVPFHSACNIVTACNTVKFCSKLKQTFLQCSFLTVCEMTARSGSCSQLRLPIPHKLSPITSLLHERIRETRMMHKTPSYIWFRELLVW